MLVSKTQHHGRRATPSAQCPPDASHGVEARYKKGGAERPRTSSRSRTRPTSWRERDGSVEARPGKDPNASEAIIIADTGTPYRLLCEVLFTLGQTEFSKFHLMVMQGKKP